MGGNVFKKKILMMVNLSKALMGSSSERMYLFQVPNFGLKIIKLRPGGWLAREGSLGVVPPSESIKDRTNVGFMIEEN